MIAQVARVGHDRVRSNGEALLLENNLIKALEPRYNILFRDDKSYPVRVPVGRSVPAAALPSRHARPQASGISVRSRARARCATASRRCRRCSRSALREHVFANRSRPCMLHQIQRCTAPCVGLVSEVEYAEDVNSALLFLQGKTDEVLAQLKRQMEEASGALDFERAARVRDKIHRMQQLQSRQFVESATAGDIDVVAAALEDGVMAVNVVMIRGGRHVGDRTFFPRQAIPGTPAEGISAFLPQHYVERPVPPTIIAPEADDAEALAEVLTQQSGARWRSSPTRAASGACG
jgi:excinuclease ABC subunit C